MKTTELPRANSGSCSLDRLGRPYALMVRIAGWMLTHEGIFRLTEHVDAKTRGKKARWKTWDRVWPNAQGEAQPPAK